MCAESDTKQEWWRAAERAYEEFERKRAQNGRKLGTLRQLEEQACEAGEQLARFLIESSIAEAPQPTATDSVDCPCCGKRARPTEDGAVEREVRTKAGDTAWKRQGFYCPSCRRVFFPCRPRAGSQGGELQSVDPRTARVGRRQPGVLSEGQ